MPQMMIRIANHLLPTYLHAAVTATLVHSCCAALLWNIKPAMLSFPVKATSHSFAWVLPNVWVLCCESCAGPSKGDTIFQDVHEHGMQHLLLMHYRHLPSKGVERLHAGRATASDAVLLCIETFS